MLHTLTFDVLVSGGHVSALFFAPFNSSQILYNILHSILLQLFSFASILGEKKKNPFLGFLKSLGLKNTVFIDIHTPIYILVSSTIVLCCFIKSLCDSINLVYNSLAWADGSFFATMKGCSNTPLNCVLHPLKHT